MPPPSARTLRRRAARARDRHVRACRRCGGPIPPSAPTHKIYCGRACNVAAADARTVARRSAVRQAVRQAIRSAAQDAARSAVRTAAAAAAP